MRIKTLLFTGIAFALLSACAVPGTPVAPKTFTISAIPDQDPEKLNRLYGAVAKYFTTKLGVNTVYRPVTDYTAVSNAFITGDIDAVWFGGLTGVQTRLQVPGAQAIAQRDIDAQFTSVFIASSASGIQPLKDQAGLSALKARTFTFGSDSSTSGRLMPQHFMGQAGVKLADLKGEAGFSGSHDKTIKLVESGAYDVGVLNSQVWDARVKAKEVDLTRVSVIWTTPPYFDYHWIVRPDADQKFGNGFSGKFKQAILDLDVKNAEHKEIMDLFGAQKFVETRNENYKDIEAVGREIGKIK